MLDIFPLLRRQSIWIVEGHYDMTVKPANLHYSLPASMPLRSALKNNGRQICGYIIGILDKLKEMWVMAAALSESQ